MANKSSMKRSPATHRVKVITASVRTTTRMNALLNESIHSARRKALSTSKDGLNFDEQQQIQHQNQSLQKHDRNKMEIKFFHRNFCMDHVYKLIAETIEDRLQWDRFNRIYDPWRTPQFAESMAQEITDRVKELNYKRHRIVCILSIVEKQHQGIDYKMRHLMDEKNDNFTNYIHERGTYTIIVTLWLVYKE